MGNLKKNLIYNIIYQILIILLPLVTSPYISRVLGSEGIGIYSYSNSVAYYFVMLAMLGISNHGNRSIAAVREDKEKLSKTFCSIYAFQVITFFVSSSIYIIYILFIVRENRVIFAIQFIYVISGMFDISWLFFGLEKFKLTVTRNVIIKISTVIVIFLVVNNRTDLWKYTLIMSTGMLISQLYLWKYVKENITMVKITLKDIKSHLKSIFILFIPVIAYSIYKFMDKIMLGNMTTFSEVGIFQNAEKLINIPMGIITALGIVMLPRMSNLLSKKDTEKSSYYIIISIKLVTLIGSAIAFGMYGISEVLSPIYFGNEFLGCVPVIKLLSMTVFFVAWANVIRTQYLIPNKYDKIYIISTFIGAIFNLLANFMLIPQYQAIGAAIGTIIAEFSVLVIQIFLIRKKLPALKYVISTAPILGIGLVMSIFVKYIGKIGGIKITTLILQIMGGGIVYLILILIYFIITKDVLWTEIKKSYFNIVKRGNYSNFNQKLRRKHPWGLKNWKFLK